MVGTSWEVTTHLTPGVITTLPGAEHLGEANSWSEDPNKQETNVQRRVGGSQASPQGCVQGETSGILPEQGSLQTVHCRKEILTIAESWPSVF